MWGIKGRCAVDFWIKCLLLSGKEDNGTVFCCPSRSLTVLCFYDTCHSIISRWLLKLHVTKCLLNGSYSGLREPKLLSIVRSSEKLICLVRTTGLFCADTCFQMSLGSNSFRYEDFHAYLVSGRFWDYSNIFMYGVEKIQKCFYLYKCSQR